jgi:hypothetical protein
MKDESWRLGLVWSEGEGRDDICDEKGVGG